MVINSFNLLYQILGQDTSKRLIILFSCYQIAMKKVFGVFNARLWIFSRSVW